MLKFAATCITALASLFVLTGSAWYLNNPEIPAELRRKDA